ncbi:MAG: hypothetical protein J7452_02895 [Thermoflexus sp.]|nr:hypothetical protein [Thermoflexus sp.]
MRGELWSLAAGPALKDRPEEFFRGAFEDADAFACSEPALRRDPAAMQAALRKRLREARGNLIPLER